MVDQSYRISVEAADHRSASEGARDLADELREVAGVLDSQRQKNDQDTMDLGSVVALAATSGASVAIARQLGSWLRRTRGTSITIEVRGKSTSIKAVLAISDPKAASRVKEVEQDGTASQPG